MAVCNTTENAPPEVEAYLREVGVNNMVIAYDPRNTDDLEIDLKLPVIFIGNLKNVFEVNMKLYADDFFGNRIEDFTYNYNFDIQSEKKAYIKKLDVKLKPGFYFIKALINAGGRKFYRTTTIGVIPPYKSGEKNNSLFAADTDELLTGNDLKILQLLGIKIQNTGIQITCDSCSNLLDEFINRLQNAVKHRITFLPTFRFDSQQNLKTNLPAYKAFNEYLLHANQQNIDIEQVELQNADIFLDALNNRLSTINPVVQSLDSLKHRCDNLRFLQRRNITNNLYTQWFYKKLLEAEPIKNQISVHSSGCAAQDFIFQNTSLQHTIFADSSTVDSSATIFKFPVFWYKNSDIVDTLQQQKFHILNRIVKQKEGAEILEDLFTGDDISDLLHESNDSMMIATLGNLQEIELALQRYDLGEQYNLNANASALVKNLVMAFLSGTDQIRYNWKLLSSAQAIRVFTVLGFFNNLIEDRREITEIWQKNDFFQGAVFSKAGTDSTKKNNGATNIFPFSTNKTSNDAKIAIIWDALAKQPAQNNDDLLIIRDIDDIRAFNISGYEIESSWGRLKIPFTNSPVYLITNELSKQEFISRIENAEIKTRQPIVFQELPLLKSYDSIQKLRIRVENMLNSNISGVLSTSSLNYSHNSSIWFMVDANAKRNIELLWKPVSNINSNSYPIIITLKTGDKLITRRCKLQSNRFVKKTLLPDGNLSDWSGIYPLLIQDNNTVELPHNKTNKRPEFQNRMQLYTAYDSANIYLAAAVNEQSFEATSTHTILQFFNQDNNKDITNQKQCIQDAFFFSFCFDITEPISTTLTSHLVDSAIYEQEVRSKFNFVAYGTQKNAKLKSVTQYGGMVELQNAHHSKIAIRRNRRKMLTVYEIAIPRQHIPFFASNKQAFYFCYNLFDNSFLKFSNCQYHQFYYNMQHALNNYRFLFLCSELFGIEK